MGKLPQGFTRLPSGSIRWRVSVNGRRYTGTADTLAQARMQRSRAEIDAGGIPSHSPTVDELLAGHLEASRRAKTTLDNWDWALSYVPEAFKAREVAQVTPSIVSALWRQMREAGAPPHALVKARNVCSQAWQDAITLGAAVNNPWRLVPPPSPPSADEITPPAPERVREVIDLAGTRMLALWLRLAARTGARGGELCGLQWGDVRFDTHDLVITRSVTRNGDVTGGKTGRKGHRVVPIDETTSGMLDRHERHPDCPWVFTIDGRGPWPPDRPALALRRLCVARNEKAERDAADSGGEPVLWEVLTPHDFRHFAATQWLAAGVPVPTVAYLLGDNPKTVMSTYAHWIPAQGREAVEGLGRLLDG